MVKILSSCVSLISTSNNVYQQEMKHNLTNGAQTHKKVFAVEHRRLPSRKQIQTRPWAKFIKEGGDSY